MQISTLINQNKNHLLVLEFVTDELTYFCKQFKNFFLLKTIICAFLTASLLYACAQQPQKQAKVVQVADSAKSLPGLPQLSENEIRRYSQASGHFFDSLLGRGFNGCVLV